MSKRHREVARISKGRMNNKAIFTTETFHFFRELGRNNHKAWMDQNRERYRQHVIEPFRALLDALTPVAQKLNPRFDVSGRTGINFSRINRDIRFAKDKSPYRSQMYLMFAEPSAAGDVGQLYVALSSDTVTSGFRIYSGSKMSALAQIARPRALANARWLAQQARRLGKKYDCYWYSMEKGEWTKHNGWPTRPEGWKRIKGWIVRRKMKPSAAVRAGLVAEVGKIFREVFPLYQFTSAKNWRG